MKLLKIILPILLVLVLVVLLGPQPDFDPVEPAEIEQLDMPLEVLEDYVREREIQTPGIRPDNEARIIWFDSIPSKTRYAVVYLHGFSASQKEGDPVHLEFAQRYGFNLYLPRLAHHGIEGEESMTGLTPNKLIASAKEAIAVGQLLGDDVIVISCSTGGTLSVYLAAANPETIDAMLLFSPNIEIRDQTTKILTKPWGLTMGKMIAGDFHEFGKDREPGVDQYWTTKYRIEAIVALQWLLEETMTPEVFEQVSQPYLMGLYYKNEEEQDPTISVAAARRFTTLTTTPPHQKRVVEYPEAGAHVVTSAITSKDLESVRQSAWLFAEEVLRLVPVNP